MSEIKKIMVALAFSKHSPSLFDYAAQLATDLDAKLVVGSIINIRDVDAVDSIESMGYKVDTDQYIKGIEDDRISMLDEIMKKFAFPREKMKVVFRVGHPFAELIKIVKDEAIDMVVMGTKAHSDLEHVLLGSVADKMLHHSPVPVVSFRKKG